MHIRFTSVSSTFVFLLVATSLSARADNISPGLTSKGNTYSLEQPNQQYYGNGVASRATEASTLRLEAQRDLNAGRIHEALRKARKAVQFDPDVADGHLILARSMSACLKADDYKDADMYQQCMNEWRMLRWHDADSTEQQEAGKQLAKLRLAKVFSRFKSGGSQRPTSM